MATNIGQEATDELQSVIDTQAKEIRGLRAELKKMAESLKASQAKAAAAEVVKPLKGMDLFRSRYGSDFSEGELQLLYRFVDDKRKWLSGTSPWYTEGAKSWLSVNVRPNDSVIEYGGGRSTVWWCSMVNRASVVEASPEWTFWLLFYLHEHPSLLKNLRMHFVPAEWNPDFSSLSKRYWVNNREVLAESDVYRMESDLSSTAQLAGHNILVLDGAIRNFVLCRIGIEDRFKDFEMIIIDNTEAKNNSFLADHYLKDLPFTRLDFVAGPHDLVPEHQKGKHITTIYVHEDRLSKCEPVELGRRYLLTDEERAAHQHQTQPSDEALLKRIAKAERHVRQHYDVTQD
jgi:hypothetical protein